MKKRLNESKLHLLREMFTRNFGLKVLSLVLAVLLYEVLKPEAVSDGARRFTAAPAAAHPIEPAPSPAAPPPPQTVTQPPPAAPAAPPAAVTESVPARPTPEAPARSNDRKKNAKLR